LRSLTRRRTSILTIAVVALSINALVGFVHTGGAAPSSQTVHVITGVSVYEQDGTSYSLGSHDTGAAGVQCQKGHILFGGGYAASGNYNALVGGPPSFTYSAPDEAGKGWEVHLADPPGTESTFHAVAICVNITHQNITIP
jgi:hypothetical protein